jgi:hypothetical protein
VANQPQPNKNIQLYGTFGMQRLMTHLFGKVRARIVFWSGVAVLDPKFAQESESGLRSRQSPAGRDENCTQSPVSWTKGFSLWVAYSRRRLTQRVRICRRLTDPMAVAYSRTALQYEAQDLIQALLYACSCSHTAAVVVRLYEYTVVPVLLSASCPTVCKCGLSASAARIRAPPVLFHDETE